MAQYIYAMNRVSKVVPPKRVILRDSLLKRNIAKHAALLMIISAHKTETIENV